MTQIMNNTHVMFVTKHLHVLRDKVYTMEIIHIYVMLVRNPFAIGGFPKMFQCTMGRIHTLVIRVINHSIGGVI
jgi:hypothetical protein